MTPFHQTSASPSFACLDIGTNSVLLLLTSVDNKGIITEEYEGFKTTRLGQGIDESGFLRPEAIERTLEAVDMFISQAKTHCASGLSLAIVSTSAVRDAANGNAFVEPCARICGREPVILTGRQEALATYMGATSDLPATQQFLTLDIGGGSTELGLGVGSTCLFRTSLDMGCVRFGERFDLFDIPSPSAVRSARQSVRAALAEPLQEIREKVNQTDRKEIRYVASGGTATSFASLAQSLPEYDKPRVHGFHAGIEGIRSITDQLLAMPLARRTALPGLREGRGKVLPAGMLILQECLEIFEADSLRVSTRGLRYGIIQQMLTGHFKPTVVIEPFSHD